MRHICRAVVSDTKRKGDKGVIGGLAIRGAVTSVWSGRQMETVVTEHRGWVWKLHISSLS